MISTIKVTLSLEVTIATIRDYQDKKKVKDRMSRISKTSTSPTVKKFEKSGKAIKAKIAVIHDEQGITILDPALDCSGFKVCLMEHCLNELLSYTRFAIDPELETYIGFQDITVACSIHSIDDVPEELKRDILSKMLLMELSKPRLEYLHGSLYFHTLSKYVFKYIGERV